MLRLRHGLVNGLLAVLSTAVALAGVEGTARLVRHYQKGGKEQRTRLQYTQYDPLLGWKHLPGARARYERREFTADLSINSKGLRDKERGYEAPPGGFRVLALGDSFVEGFTVPYDQSVTQVMERSMASGGCRAEVINGGVVGYSTDQQLLFYREEGWKYSPDVVVVFFYYNDVLHNAARTHLQLPKPLLSFEGGQVEVVNYPVPHRPADKPTADDPRPAVKGSVALDWVGERIARSHPRSYNVLSGFGLWPPTSTRTLSPEMRVYRRQPPADARHAWAMTGRILANLAAEARGRDSRLAIAYIPSRMEVNDRDWELTRLRYGVDEETYDRSAVRARLSEIASNERIPMLDLTPPLRHATGLVSGPYHDVESQWNAIGHAVAAREVEAFLRRQGWTCAR